ncbi:MAG TPA: STAS domain-containing protein [Pseudonocardia sp.]|uniref:STAS domain-containing protein n=1 Tax=Pseudonocardia sp. TaxID=60912 RepID=UPI002EDB240B
MRNALGIAPPALDLGFADVDGADDRSPVRLCLIVHRRPGLRIVQVKGELDILTAPALLECLRLQLLMAPTMLVLDLSEVEFLAAAGLSALLVARHTGERLGCDVLLSNGLRPMVARVLQLCGWYVSAAESDE